MIRKESLIKEVDYINKLIYVNEINWELVWKNLFTKKQPYISRSGDEVIPKEAIQASSQIYKFITLTQVFDNNEENNKLDGKIKQMEQMKQNLYSMINDGYKVIYKDQEMITKCNCESYLLDELDKFKFNAIKENKIYDEDDDFIKEYKKYIILQIKETYNNLKKFL